MPSLQPHKIGLVSVVLPTYNEAGNIIALVDAIHAVVTQPNEIIVVDDNSPDGTSALIQAHIHGGKVPGLRLETRLTDRGLTKSISRGIELARGDVIVWMDCDFSHPPEVIPSLLHAIEEGWSMAVASRYMAGGKRKSMRDTQGGKESALVILLSRILNLIARILISWHYHDYTSGFIAVRREVMQSIVIRGSHGEYFLDLFARAILGGIAVTEVPFANATRREGVTKTGASLGWIFRFGRKYIALLAELWWLRVRG